MARRKASFLSKRGGIYQLRLPIPKDLQKSFGRKELRWSLQTSDRIKAESITLRSRLVFIRMCSNVRSMPSLSKNDIPKLVQRFYETLLDRDPTPSSTTVHQAEKAADDHARNTEEIVERLTQEVELNVYSERTLKLAEQVVSRNGYTKEDIPSSVFIALCNGVVRAELEFTRFLDFRQSEPILPYDPIDPLLKTTLDIGLGKIIHKEETPQLIAEYTEEVDFPSILSAIAQYVDFKTEDGSGTGAAWKLIDVPSKRRALDWFAKLVGQEICVSELNVSDFRLFRDKVKRLAKNTPAGVDIRDYQAKKSENRIHPKTANQHFHSVKAFLKWLSAEGIVENDLVGSIVLGLKSPPPPERALSKTQLNSFLESPLFKGVENPKARYVSGTQQIRDDQFWLPLLALYTGARMGELLQLKAQDFEFGEACSYFTIQSIYQLKNGQSARDVPIHEDLIDWGFREFVLEGSPEDRIFRNIKLSSPKLTSYYSQMFSRYVSKTGLKTDGFVFHSFRHTFIDACRNADIEEAKCYKIVGHKLSGAHHGYGKGANIQNLYNLIQKIDFGLSEETRKILNP